MTISDALLVEDLHPVKPDKTLVEKIAMDERKKDTIRILTESHREYTGSYDDLIAGKGEHFARVSLKCQSLML
jgi:hypothetical protein